MKHLILSLLIFFLSAHFSLQACTGLSLRAKDGAYIQARTIEWGESDLPSEYEDGYQAALQSQQRREIKIKRYARVIEGHILDFKPGKRRRS